MWGRCSVKVSSALQAKDLMGQCFDAGVNYFDNAEVYAEGARPRHLARRAPSCSQPHTRCILNTPWHACAGNSEIVMGEAIKVGSSQLGKRNSAIAPRTAWPLLVCADRLHVPLRRISSGSALTSCLARRFSGVAKVSAQPSAV